MDPAKAASNGAALREQVVPELFGMVATDQFPLSTLPGLALVHAAFEKDPQLGERASFLLRHALFDLGLDISDPAVLGELASDLGVGEVTEADRVGVLEDYTEGQRLGVIGSPHFFCGSKSHFCPSLEITQADGVRRIQLQAAELSAFLSGCLQQGQSSV